MAKTLQTMSGLVIGAVLGGCMQPGDAASNESPEAGTEPRPAVSRPTGAIQSPGPGVPSGPVSKISAAEIPGIWTLVTETADATDVRLTARDGLSVGQVEVQSAWPHAGPAPTTWLYLAYGQLTLVDAEGAVVWSGEVEGDGFSGTLNTSGQKADLVGHSN